MIKSSQWSITFSAVKATWQAVITKDFDVELMKQAILANQHG